MRAVRGGRIGLIFQEPMTALSVHYTVGNQIIEAMRAHNNISKETARERVIALLHEVGIPRPETRIDAYPFQLSGGLRQRVGIALALAADPEILIADEPTTALDVTTQAQILGLLRRLQRTKGVALMLITHDMGVIAQMADDVAVMYLGRIVEFAPVAQLFAAPNHPYTRALLRSVPNLRAVPRERLATIGGAVPHPGARPVGCPFHPRCPEVIPGRCVTETPPAIPPDRPGASCFHAMAEARRMSVLEVDGLTKEFPIRSGLLQRETGRVRAVQNVSFTIGRGETLSLVGESGCGKTTVARCILRALPPTSGAIRFSPQEGETIDMAPLSRSALRPLRRHIQMIFQDPYASLNPRMMVGDIIAEPLLVNGVPVAAAARACQRVARSRRSAGRRAHTISPCLQRRAAPAHRHRARTGARSGAGGGRRAGIRARCLGAGADHQPAARTAGPAEAVDAVRRPRSRRGAPCQRPRRGDVCRAHCRDRADHRALHQAASSLYRSAAGGGAETRSGVA